MTDPHSEKPLNYTVVSQSFDELQNSPSVLMAPYLLKQGRERLFNTISIYAERGDSREQMRLLYMNDAALKVWKEMGMTPTEIGRRYRPTRTSELAFGVPYSE